MTSPHVHREAGRELDALVAQKVMGIFWDENRCRVCGWPFDDSLNDVGLGCLPDNCSMRPVPERRADEPAAYSTDIAAAWLVVERMADDGGLQVMVELQPTKSWGEEDQPCEPNDRYRCMSLISGTDMCYREDRAYTAPLAICLAALNAVSAVSGEAQKVKTATDQEKTENDRSRSITNH